MSIYDIISEEFMKEDKKRKKQKKGKKQKVPLLSDIMDV
jgi:hypothetical protein